jgi:hypothetical protein
VRHQVLFVVQPSGGSHSPLGGDSFALQGVIVMKKLAIVLFVLFAGLQIGSSVVNGFKAVDRVAKMGSAQAVAMQEIKDAIQ